MIASLLAAALLMASGAQPMPSASRLPPRLPPPTTEQPAPQRVPIDLGPDAPGSEPPQQIDILAAPQTSEAADALELKECADQTERGVVQGEIVV